MNESCDENQAANMVLVAQGQSDPKWSRKGFRNNHKRFIRRLNSLENLVVIEWLVRGIGTNYSFEARAERGYKVGEHASCSIHSGKEQEFHFLSAGG